MEDAGSIKVYGHLETLDYLVIGLFLALSMILGLWFYRRALKDTDSFFVASGKIPWWVAGLSLLVACFAADSPLWLGDMIYRRGIEGMWILWAAAVGSAFFVMMIAPLWKRSGIVSDLEFLEFRYSSRAATLMRLVSSIYYSTFFAVMMLAVSTLSMVIIMQATTGLSKLTCIMITIGGAAVYCVISGMWGVATSGVAQCIITFTGAVILSVFSVHKAGGMDTMLEKIGQIPGWSPSPTNVMPKFDGTGLPIMTIVFLLGLRWIEQAGIGQWVAQRIFTVKGTKQAVFTSMVWAIGFFSIIPLPWIVTIVASKIVLPNLETGQQAYPRMAMLLPAGLKGVLIASMLAAFMSTYSSLLSWGSTYAVNDLYRRFIVKKASARHYVRASQTAMLPLVIASGLITYYAESILNLLFYAFLATTGYYTVQLLRWFWWRVNAWAEVAGLLGSLFFTLTVCLVFPDWIKPEYMEQYYGHRMTFVTAATFILCLIVIFVTKPTPDDILDKFYKKVRPMGFWGPVRKRLKMKSEANFGTILLHWLTMIFAIYGFMFGLLKIIFNEVILGAALLSIGITGCTTAVIRTRKFYANDLSESEKKEEILEKAEA